LWTTRILCALVAAVSYFCRVLETAAAHLKAVESPFLFTDVSTIAARSPAANIAIIVSHMNGQKSNWSLKEKMSQIPSQNEYFWKMSLQRPMATCAENILL
jgi:hypothetical protein